jgi:hypothetical protein
VTAFSWILLLPLYILAALLLVLGTFALLGRIKGGKYLRPVVATISKVPIRKMERMGATTDPRKAQTAIGRLTPAERRAYMAAAQEQGYTDQMPQNRQMRRKLEKMQREGRRGGS